MLPPSAYDKEGFLRDRAQWSPEVAEQIATSEGIRLETSHWEIITLLRQYYEEFESSPAMRPLVKYCARELGPDKGKSIYLMSLFPGSPAKIGVEITALDGCGFEGDGFMLVDVKDVTPPSIDVSLDPDVLWSPNHKMQPLSSRPLRIFAESVNGYVGASAPSVVPTA